MKQGAHDWDKYVKQWVIVNFELRLAFDTQFCLPRRASEPELVCQKQVSARNSPPHVLNLYLFTRRNVCNLIVSCAIYCDFSVITSH